MKPRGTLLLGLCVGSLVLAQPALGADAPPRTLHQVGDHWTAWDPPTPPEGQQVYTIVPGDTLWALAAKLYSNPYLWPQIWEKNQYIQDAHWIYPGDPLVTGLEVAAPTTETAIEDGTVPASPGVEEGTETAAAEPGPAPLRGVLTAAAAAGPPVPLAGEDDIYCSGYIGDLDETFGYKVVGSEYQALADTVIQAATKSRAFGSMQPAKLGLYTGDIVYLDGGRAAGLEAGSVFTAVTPGDVVKHPASGAVVGRYYNYVGRVRVLSVQESSGIGEIVQSCAPLMIGTALKPFEPEPVPLGRRTTPRPASDPPPAGSLDGAPVILTSVQGQVSLGENHVVQIEAPAGEELTPGDIFTVYRPQAPGLPPLMVGEVAVLSVHPHAAVAKVLDSRYTLYAGDRLLRK